MLLHWPLLHCPPLVLASPEWENNGRWRTSQGHQRTQSKGIWRTHDPHCARLLGPDKLPAVLVPGMRDDIYSLSSILRANEHTGSPGKVAIFTESGAVLLKSESCQELLQQAIHQGTQTHVADQIDGIYVLRPASVTTMAHVHSFSTAHANQEDTSGLYAGYTRPGRHWLPGIPCTTDHRRLETV